MKLLLILTSGLILRLIGLNQSFWLDEAAQVIESSRPFLQQFNLAADFHPPLYHLLLHFWLKGGSSEIWVRLLSVMLGVGSLVYIYRLARIRLNQYLSLAVTLLLAVSAYHVYYSQEARPYILFSLLVLVSTYYLMKKNYTAFAVSLIACWYTSYFTLFLLFGQGLVVYFQEKKDIKKFITAFFVSLLFFLPWLPEVKRQLDVGFGGSFTGWQEVVSFGSFRNLGLTFARFSLGRLNPDNNFLYLLLVSPLAVFALWSLYESVVKRKFTEYAILFWGPFTLAILISFFLPVVAPQRLLFLLPFLYLSIVSHLGGVKVVLYLLIFISLASLAVYYYNPLFQRENWRAAVSYVDQTKTESLAVFAFPEPFAPYQLYARYTPAIGAAVNFRVEDDDLARLSANLSGKQKVYLFDYLRELTDPEKKLELEIEAAGFRESSVNNFEGVGFVRTYEKQL